MMGGYKAGQIVVQRGERSQMVKPWRLKAIIMTC